MSIMTILGTRPELLKVSRDWSDIIVNTGQHYDRNMNDIHDPGCDENLNSTTLGNQIENCVDIINKHNPVAICVIGDTRSTYSGAVAAKYVGKTLIHVESGMRCNNMNIIEERIRTSVDGMADYKLCTNIYCQINLSNEGLAGGSFIVGDPMFDRMQEVMSSPLFSSVSQFDFPYYLMTLHRAELINDILKLEAVMGAISGIKHRIVWPIHPHTYQKLKDWNIRLPENITTMSPTSHEDMLNLIMNSQKVCTDSGGIQREAYWLNIPVIIVREETEHMEIVYTNRGKLVGCSDASKISQTINEFGFDSDTIGQIEFPKANANQNIKSLINSVIYNKK